jgi:uncharacterized membrane protein YjjP (DUF1212 family)
MAESVDLRAFLDLLRETCRHLIECGCSSNRVETLTTRLGESWGVEVETLAIPTGVWISVRKGGENYIELTRVRRWSVDLDRLARLNEMVEHFHAHRITLAEAHERLTAVARAGMPYSRWLTLVAGSMSGPILVYNYGGSREEIALALPIGLGVTFLHKYVLTGENGRYLADFLCAVFVAVCACVAAKLVPGVDVPRLIVGGLVVLVPGLVFVNAVHEVAQKNLVSGAAKLLEALVITASLGCGVIFVLGILLNL